MVNMAPILYLYHMFADLTAASLGAILAASVGLPIRRRIIRKWARR